MTARFRSWRAQLALEFECRGARTVLAARRHDGPLLVQKPLYPEGGEVCHTIIVHSPAGIVGGDGLEVAARLGSNARAPLTTPGASKWYRSAGSWARQRMGFHNGAGGCLEWLPQSIVFNGVLAELRTEVELEADACFIGWEILCLGRTGSGESFAAGACRMRTLIQRGGKPLWLKRSSTTAVPRSSSRRWLGSRGNLRGRISSIGESPARSLSREEACCGSGAVTTTPGLFVGRYLGSSSEATKKYFRQ